MATIQQKPKTPISSSAMGALIFGFLFAPLALYFGIRTFEETKQGDQSRAWAIAGIALGALQVFIVIAFVIASAVQMKHGMYYAPGQYPNMMPGRM